MKKTILLLLIVLSSCSQVEEVPPENLIGKEKMADLIFELAIVDASKGFVPKEQKERVGLDSESFYDHHDIDSVQFTTSSAYYAKQPKTYLRIVNAAKERLAAFEKKIELSEIETVMIDSLMLKSVQDKNIDK